MFLIQLNARSAGNVTSPPSSRSRMLKRSSKCRHPYWRRTRVMSSSCVESGTSCSISFGRRSNAGRSFGSKSMLCSCRSFSVTAIAASPYCSLPIMAFLIASIDSGDFSRRKLDRGGFGASPPESGKLSSREGRRRVSESMFHIFSHMSSSSARLLVPPGILATTRLKMSFFAICEFCARRWMDAAISNLARSCGLSIIERINLTQRSN